GLFLFWGFSEAGQRAAQTLHPLSTWRKNDGFELLAVIDRPLSLPGIKARSAAGPRLTSPREGASATVTSRNSVEVIEP
ncbi:MAG: hypothetical protein ACRC6I_12495, partial [Paracoccaceae bacterium]